MAKEKKEKKTKREEFAEHKQAALDKLDLVVNNGALYFHADTDPACYYRLAANDPGIYGLLNDATGEDLTPREQDELLQGIIRHAMDPRNLEEYKAEEAPPALVLFKNGLYSLDEGVWKGEDPETVEKLKAAHQIFTSYIPHEFNPDIVLERDRVTVDRFFSSLSCGDQDVESLLYEVIGYCFYRSCIFRKALLLKGAKGCGKSTFLDMVRNILGAGATTALSLKELSDKFSTIELAGKLANIGDELDKEYIATSSKFKSIVSGMMISGQKKYGDVVNFAPYAKMLFAMNGDLRMDDPGNAVADRLIQIPFPASLRREDIDPYLPEKLRAPGAIQYVTEKALKAFIDVLDRGHFTTSMVAERTRREWECYNNPIQAWLGDFVQDGNTVVGRVDGDLLFNYFNPWAKDQQMKVQYSLPNFRQELVALIPGLEVGTRTRYREDIDGYPSKEKWGYKLTMNNIGGVTPLSVLEKDNGKDDARNDDKCDGKPVKDTKTEEAPKAQESKPANVKADLDWNEEEFEDFFEDDGRKPEPSRYTSTPVKRYTGRALDGLEDDDEELGGA